MASKKLPESELPQSPEVVSADAEFWFDQFLKHAKIAFQDRCQSLSDNPSHDEVQRATIEALVETLFESGASQESLIEALGQMTLNRDTEIPWTATMNSRRVDLIDRDLQGTATLEEQAELAKLTAVMRIALDTEENIPMAGAKQLHEKLLNLSQQEKPR